MNTTVRLIKKYPNRRLYDTQTSTYITLSEVKRYVLDNVTFAVVDAKTNEDLTRSILLQIILEEESGGVPMFSADMLANIIRFYGHAMQGMMGSYLEKNIQSFMDFQKTMQEQSKGLMPNPAFTPDAWTQFMSTNYVEQTKNMFLQMQEQLQTQAKSMFSAFGAQPGKKS